MSSSLVFYRSLVITACTILSIAVKSKSQCSVSSPTISSPNDICRVVSLDTINYTCNINGASARWTSSIWYDALLASAGSSPTNKTLYLDGITLTKSDDNNNTCLKSTLTFTGTLTALTALNGVVLNCAASNQSPAAHATITIPVLPGAPLLFSNILSSTGNSGGIQKVILQWTPPTNTGGQGVRIAHYNLTGLHNVDCSPGPCDVISGTSTTISGNLQYDTCYMVAIRAVNCRGVGKTSNHGYFIFKSELISVSNTLATSTTFPLKSSYLEAVIPTQLPIAVVSQQMNMFWLIVGIPAALLLTAIITALVTLLITHKCLIRGRNQKSDTPSAPSEEEPLFKPEKLDPSDRSPSPVEEHDLSLTSDSSSGSPSPVKEYKLSYKTEEDPVYDYIPVTSMRANETTMKSNVAYGSSPVDGDDSNYD